MRIPHLGHPAGGVRKGRHPLNLDGARVSPSGWQSSRSLKNGGRDWNKWRWWCEGTEGEWGRGRILDKGKKQSDFLGLVRMIIVMSMNLVLGTTRQLFLSLSNILATDSINAY